MLHNLPDTALILPSTAQDKDSVESRYLPQWYNRGINHSIQASIYPRMLTYTNKYSLNNPLYALMVNACKKEVDDT